LAGGEVPVERADADAGLAGDRLERRVLAGGEGMGGHLQQAVAVALRVGAQRPLSGGRHGRSLLGVAKRRILRIVCQSYRRRLRSRFYGPPRPIRPPEEGTSFT